MADAWHVFDDPRFELRFRYPDPTPRGRTVTPSEGGYSEGLRMHFASAERELYVEVVRFPLLPHDEEYRRHRAYLEGRFGERAVTQLADATLAGRPAHTYAFSWPEGRRIALLLSTAAWTYRVIYNPDSELNARVIETFEVTPRPAHRPSAAPLRRAPPASSVQRLTFVVPPSRVRRQLRRQRGRARWGGASMTSERFVTIVLFLGALFFLLPGIWAFIAPHSFYDQLATFPPYNRHLVHDIGACQIGIGAALLLALRWGDAKFVALAGAVAGALVHLLSHIIDHDQGGADSDVFVFGLAAVALVAAAVARWQAVVRAAGD